jgi:dTDP-L-rhamnose 4-epimerase
MRVLVTGGAGLIGSHLADELLARGYEVTILDNLEPEVHPHGRPSWVPQGARFVEGDVRDAAALERALEGCSGVFHQAVYGGFSPAFSKMSDVNCTGTARLFEAVARGGRVERVVTASSMAVYGEGWYRCAEHGPFHGETRDAAARERGRWELACPRCGAETVPHPIPESSDLRPHGTYSISKLFQERMTLDKGTELGIHSVALRYFLTFGARQSLFNPYSGICSIFSTQILNGKRPVVYEDGSQTRDILVADDVARACRIVLEDPRAAGRVFNVASGRSTSVADFARLLARAYGSDVEPVCPRRFRLMDNRHMLGDASALRALGWSIEVPLEEGVKRYVEWIRAQGAVGEYFSRAEARLRELGIVREARA